MRLRAIFVALMFSATSALSNTISLDFDNGFLQQADNYGLGGTWNSGFNLTATTAEYLSPGDIADISRISTNDTGHTVNANSLTITRTKNRTFSLQSLNIPSFVTNVFANWYGTDNSTGLDFRSTAPLLMDIVSLKGVTAAGQVVTHSFLPMNASTSLTSGPAYASAMYSSANPIFDLSAHGFDDLLSLQLTASANTSESVLCRPENLSQVDPRFAASGFCDGTLDPNGPVSDVSAWTSLGGRNDFAYFDFAGVNVSVAAVPVPAAAWMLLAGFMSLAFLKRRGTLI